MEVLLLGIYSFFVWLIFFKFKWLPWNTTSQVIVITLPIVGLTALILALNAVAPSSHDVRVVKYYANMSSYVRGRVVYVAEGNKPLRKGDVLYRIDPTPYQLQVNALEAQLANSVGSSKELEEQLSGSVAQVAQSKSAIDQASSRVASAAADLELATKRVAQNRELVAKGAGNRFDLEQAETNLRSAQSAMDSARSAEAQARGALAQALAGERQIRQRMGAKSGGEWAQIAQTRAQLEQAKFDLSQTTVVAPANGTPINVQLRPGALIATAANAPALTFVEDEFSVIALYEQNELTKVRPGDEAEIVLETLPGEIIKAKVDSIVWAQGQGQVVNTVGLPQTGAAGPPPGRFPVKLSVDPKFRDVFFAAGARGNAAIYTEHVEEIQILRKVILRINTKINYLILKLH
ncbi:HlyD family secretion protein [Ramlibacter ginsenosidimutans]|uniref:HlyD family secretion protein n=1 Tax=Ramlibacter ginsenosidimutans TaxID=502333 RepID=A0A934WPW4_9BURK|nr:biotin/lipoyl-binding protein [Ramlibacter ginsenosidimutans]MBK6008522.1 HlyD family secretion protein [Ramlibacter ginsenosidimutans]